MCSWRWEVTFSWRGKGHARGGGRGPTQGGSIGGRTGSMGLEPVREKKQPTSVRYPYILSPGPS